MIAENPVQTTELSSRFTPLNTYIVLFILIVLIENTIMYFKNNKLPNVSSLSSNLSCLLMCSFVIHFLGSCNHVAWGYTTLLLTCLFICCMSTVMSEYLNPPTYYISNLSKIVTSESMLPQSVAQPVPQPVTQPVPQPVTQTFPQSVPQPVPQSVQQLVPQPVQQPLVESENVPPIVNSL